jgi:hypothetical protein
LVGRQSVSDYFYSILSGPILIGGYSARVSSVAMWSVALSLAQLQSLYFLTLDPPHPFLSASSSLLMWLPLNEGSGLVVLDRGPLDAGGNRLGQLVNNPIWVGCNGTTLCPPAGDFACFNGGICIDDAVDGAWCLCPVPFTDTHCL